MLAKRQGESDIQILWPLNDRHMPVTFNQLFTSLPRGQISEQEIEPNCLEAFYAARATLPANFRDSDEYGRLLRSILANVVPEVSSEVTKFTDTHFPSGPAKNSPTVGVHIRRSEHPMPLCEFAQPLRYYEAVMRSFPSNTRFFVSTDSQEAFRWLSSRFENRIFQQDKRRDDRSSIAGVREGLIDLLLLSRCNAIIGTSDSSFSRAAGIAGDCPVLWVKDFPSIPPNWPAFNHTRWLWSYRHFFLESTFWRRWLYWTVRPYAICIPRIPSRCGKIAAGLFSKAKRVKV